MRFISGFMSIILWAATGLMLLATLRLFGAYDDRAAAVGLGMSLAAGLAAYGLGRYSRQL